MSDHGSECSICLSSISCMPFGICNPCGHPFHRECWAGLETSVLARNLEDGGRPKKKKLKITCPICKCVSKSFINVFLEFAGPSSGVSGSNGSSGSNGLSSGVSGSNGLCSILSGSNGVTDNSAAEVSSDWDSILEALEAELYGTEGEEEVMAIVHSVGSNSSSSSRGTPFSPIEIFESGSSRRSRRRRPSEQLTRQLGTLQRLRGKHDSMAASLRQQARRREEMERAHSEMKDELQSAKSALSDAQARGEELQTQLTSMEASLQTANDNLQAFSLETERAKRQLQQKTLQYQSLLDSHHSLADRQKHTQNRLQQLQKELNDATEQRHVQDVKEVQQMQRSHQRVAQSLHDERCLRRNLENEVDRLKSKLKKRKQACTCACISARSGANADKSALGLVTVNNTKRSYSDREETRQNYEDSSQKMDDEDDFYTQCNKLNKHNLLDNIYTAETSNFGLVRVNRKRPYSNREKPRQNYDDHSRNAQTLNDDDDFNTQCNKRNKDNLLDNISTSDTFNSDASNYRKKSQPHTLTTKSSSYDSKGTKSQEAQSWLNSVVGQSMHYKQKSLPKHKSVTHEKRRLDMTTVINVDDDDDDDDNEKQPSQHIQQKAKTNDTHSELRLLSIQTKPFQHHTLAQKLRIELRNQTKQSMQQSQHRPQKQDQKQSTKERIQQSNVFNSLHNYFPSR